MEIVAKWQLILSTDIIVLKTDATDKLKCQNEHRNCDLFIICLLYFWLSCFCYVCLSTVLLYVYQDSWYDSNLKLTIII